MKNEQSRFRITPWPQVALPHPTESGGFPYIYEPEADALRPDWDNAKLPFKRAEPTTETYLKLADLDLEDTGALVQFVNDYGSLDMRGEYTPYSEVGDGAFAFRTDTEHPVLKAAYERAAAVIPEGEFADTLTEIRWAILYMRDLITARRVIDQNLDPAAQDWQSPLWDGMHELDSPPWTHEGPTTTLSLALHVALGPYSPRLRVFTDDEPPPGEGNHDVGLWTVCCLELFNHILERAAYKVCSNETCGRLFVRQEGRSAHGQFRMTGVKYCSWSCSRAQAQRQSRRRKRQQST